MLVTWPHLVGRGTNEWKGRTMMTDTMAAIERITAPSGVTVSYDTYGSGPPLVLVHGGFSDHRTNWQEVKAMLADRFSVYAVARRGRGESSATQGHSVEDEAADVAALLHHIGEPAFLLGHSYGALCALEAATLHPAAVRSLVLYEPPYPHIMTPEVLAPLEAFAEREDWDGLVRTFMLDVVQVPLDEVNEIRASPFWSVWTADAKATLNDVQAVVNYRFDATLHRSLGMPVLFLIGTESPRDLYLTDALAAVLPDARIVELEGQAHEGMTTAPAQFVDAIAQFLTAR
jgi:pimeloyl-ACP methyl ester carboxylesterase